MAITYSIPIGAPTILAQNVEYALPNRACLLIGSAAVEVAQSLGGTYAAHTSGQYALGNFVRSALANTTVTCKRL